MAHRVITTSISDEQYDLCRKMGWTWSNVIKAGVGALIKPDVTQEKIIRMEQEINALKKVRDNTKRIMGWRS